MPPAGAEIKFHHYTRQGHAPFVIYADFEAYLQTIEQPAESSEAGARRPTTIRSTLHKPIAIGALIVAGKPIFPAQEGFSTGLQRSEYFCEMGEDATTDFLNKLIEWEAFCLAEMEKNHPFLGRPPWRYGKAQECYLCHKEFVKDDPIKQRVLDHDHFTGEYLGAAHANCNLQRRKSFKIPVFFHNFRGYDSHFIVKAFHLYPERKINVIAQTMEKYLQVEWGERIVFRDSLQFLSASLDSLITSLTSSKGKFTYFDRHIRQQFNHRHYGADRASILENIDLLQKKGVFPYEYVDSFDRLDEKRLPTRDQFFDRLHDKECSEEDYSRAVKVWKTFQCEDLADYMFLYLSCDVLLLADVFENFRSTSFEFYTLDPAYYLSAPQLAWDALLKYSQLHIQLQTDPEIYRMIQPAIRGGHLSRISSTCTREQQVHGGALRP